MKFHLVHLVKVLDKVLVLDKDLVQAFVDSMFKTCRRSQSGNAVREFQAASDSPPAGR